MMADFQIHVTPLEILYPVSGQNPSDTLFIPVKNAK